MADEKLVEMLKSEGGLKKFSEHLKQEGVFRADLSHADLHGADLTNADLSFCDLSHADLSGAILTAAHLVMSNLAYANLDNACVASANFIRADLRGVDLSKVISLDEACFGKAILEKEARLIIAFTTVMSFRNPETDKNE